MRAIWLAGLALLWAGPATAAVKVGLNSQRPVPTETCEAYPDVPAAPDGPIYRVPAWECDVSDMTVAVYEEGRFRPSYGSRDAIDTAARDEKGVSADTVIDPVIDRLRLKASRVGKDQPLRILFFAHGGMVSHAAAIESAERLAPAIQTDGFAPVFLVWNSDFPTSYGNRLCCVRDGERDRSHAITSAPSRLFGDVVASFARAPQNFGGQLLRFNESVIRQNGKKYYLTPGEELADHEDGLCAQLAHTDCPTIVFPPYDLGAGEADAEATLNGRGAGPRRGATYTLLMPTRMAGTFVLPEAGANAWNNMVRRTRMPFQRSTVPAASTVTEAGCKNIPDKENAAGFAVFFDRLACELGSDRTIRASDGRLVPVELYFYGHSMGALVGNETLALHPELPWKEVVYMAAASTIRDFRLSAVPTLLRHGDARFYNLTLHPLNESRELVMGGIAPQGSLLEWIDEMFEGPRSPDERMLGKWNNLKRTFPLIPADVRRRTTIRVFPKSDANLGGCIEAPTGGDIVRCHPVTHGEFNKFSFWRRPYREGGSSAEVSKAEAAAGR